MSKNSTINLPFDPNGNIFRWGPVPVEFLYVSMFVETHYKNFRAKYGENWSETLWLFKDGRSLWLNDTPAIEAAGAKVFVRYMLPRKSRAMIYQEWQKDTHAVLSVFKKIDAKPINKITDAKLKALWNELNDAYREFWVTGSVPELANYGSPSYLKEKLRSYIKNEQALAPMLEVLTAPTRMSFYQEEEVALARARDLVKHQQKFYWLKNSYAGTEVLPVEFFAKRKSEISKNIAKETKQKFAQAVTQKKMVQKQYRLPAEIMKIVDAINDGICWQDERKKYIFMILHYIDVLTREVARRFKYDFNELHHLWYNQINDIILGKDLHAELVRRSNGFGVRFFHKCAELSGEEVEYFWNLYTTEKIAEGMTEVKGIVASKGKSGLARGRVHILFDPNKAESFKDGEVLMAPMTSPEYVFAMKKAVAVITDTGGLTSHAAIVSRELEIPCLVGTKIATKVFKDGDLVEVDATKGVVRKIK